MAQYKQYYVLRIYTSVYLVHLQPKFVHKKLCVPAVPFLAFRSHVVWWEMVKDLSLPALEEARTSHSQCDLAPVTYLL